MTNDKTVTMSREALLAAANRLSDIGQNKFAAPLWEALAAPVVERQPVAWIKPDVAATLRGDECCYAFGEQNPKGTLIPLYASPPAPVAVVLPERECEDCFQNDQSEQAIGFNRAIDMVKELNQFGKEQ